jgi:arylsulfatase A-like enzyme
LRFVDPEQTRSSWSDAEKGSGQDYLWSWNRAFLKGKEDPRAFPAAKLDALQAFYDGGIAYADAVIGQLLSRLATLTLLKDTLIIITSDHGEAFLEHNLFMHQEVYEQLLHVPLIVKYPGVDQGDEISDLVSILDIAPTILRTTGIDLLSSMAGRVLPFEPVVDNDDRWLFGYYLCPPSFNYRAFTVFNDSWKLVRHNFGNVDHYSDEFYTVQRGVSEVEQSDLAHKTLLVLRSRLEQRINIEPTVEPALFQPSAETVELLKTIGYID